MSETVFAFTLFLLSNCHCVSSNVCPSQTVTLTSSCYWPSISYASIQKRITCIYKVLYVSLPLYLCDTLHFCDQVFPLDWSFFLSFLFISYYLAECLQLQESRATTIMSLFISHGSVDLLSSARWFLICFIQLVTDDNLGRNHQEHFFTYLFSNVCWLSAETPAGAVARTPTYNYFYIKCGEL